MLSPQRRQQMDAVLGRSAPTLTPQRRQQMDAVLGKQQPGFGQKLLQGVGNVLNIPSYIAGGILKERASGSGNLKSIFKGGVQGLRDKTPVMTELPRGLGIDPQSTAGMAVGFGGELLTPSIPIAGLLGKGSKALKIGRKATKGAGLLDDIGRTLTRKSFKLAESDISKIAKSIGANDPVTKTQKVFEYLEKQGLRGATQESVETLGKSITRGTTKLGKLAKTGKVIDRQPLIDELLESAVKAEIADTPASRRLSTQLFREALEESKKLSKPLTDTDLSKRISRLFKEAKASAIGDPASTNLSKGIAKAGVEAREGFAPGATQAGRDLKGLIGTQEVIGKKANTGLGTQLVSAFRPSGLGFAGGAASGLAVGNPLLGGALGFGAGLASQSPKVLNLAGRLFSNRGKPLQGVSRLFGSKLGQRLLNTGARLPFQSNRTSLRGQSTKRSKVLPQTYNPIISRQKSDSIITKIKAPSYNTPSFSFSQRFR